MEMQGIPENQARVRAAEALVKVGIEESKHKRFPSALSGGEQQRVAISAELPSSWRTSPRGTWTGRTHASSWTSSAV